MQPSLAVSSQLAIKQNLETNIFATNLFNKNIFDNDYYFDFSSCMKSCKIPNYKFTNYFKNKKELFKYVRNEYNRFLKNDFKDMNGLLEDYEIKPFGGTERRKLIKKIINKNTGRYPNNIPIIFRLSNIHNREIQFFYYETNSGVYRIVAVDIFHLLLPANDLLRPQIKNDGEQKYLENELNNICLSEIRSNI